MWNFRSAASILVVVCISMMPAAAHACYEPVSERSHTIGDMADCPFVKELLAKQAKPSGDQQDKGDGCSPAACFLNCFHSPDVGAARVELSELPLCFEVKNFSPPLFPAHEPPTPPPQS